MAFASGRITGTSWTDLSTSGRRSPRDGQPGFVPSTDTGTHTGYYVDDDGVVTQAEDLPNAGSYVWVQSVKAWAWTNEAKEINIVISTAISIDTYRGSDDSGDIMPLFKGMVENPSSERDALLAGAALKFKGGRAYRGLSRLLITLPRYLRVAMDPSAYLDFSEVPGQYADNLMTYSGRYGMPTRPVVADYPAGTIAVQFGAGVVASRGWKPGDRLLMRATEGLDDQLVGAWSKMEYDALTPATFSFYTPGASYIVGSGVISVDDGKSYRCTTPHTAGATIDLTKFAITGLNATGEDAHIDTVVGDKVWFTAPLRYNYPSASRPIYTKYEDQGRHIFEGFRWIGNHPVDVTDAGAWLTATEFALSDMVYVSSGIGGTNRYFICLVPHTSGVFATDLAAGKWRDLGSDRVLRFALTDQVHIEGGRIERPSGRGLDVFSVADFVWRDHVGFAPNKRAAPGGFLALGGAYNKALIDNVTIHSGSQPFMTTLSGGEYGVSYGTVMRDCTAKGGSSGFTQHAMQDGSVMRGCEHDGGLAAPGGSSFDIRTPTKLLGCRAKNNVGGRALVLRHNFGGFGRGDNSDTGTTIRDFEGHNMLTGIDLDNSFFNAGAGTIGWPTGRLDMRDIRLTQIGGTGSKGAMCLMWTVGTGGVAGSGTMPLLGRLHIEGVFAEMRSDQHAIRIAGRWPEMVFDRVRVVPAAGFTPSGAFRPVWIYNGGVTGNDPIDTNIGDDISYTGSFAVPAYTAVRTDTIPTVASASTIFAPTTSEVFFLSGTTQVDKIGNAAVLRGKERLMIATGSVTITKDSGGAGSPSSVSLIGVGDRALTAGGMLRIWSDGTYWRETT